jgi:hypothetical protein
VSPAAKAERKGRAAKPKPTPPPPRQVPADGPGSDEHVTAFITEQRAADPKVGVAKLLAAYRGTGASCSQDRFRRLAAAAS